MFDSTVSESQQPHIAPEHGIPGSGDANRYLQEVSISHLQSTRAGLVKILELKAGTWFMSKFKQLM